jgi:hypothetical protein
MNIAFPAFLLFIVLLPGFIFQSAFRTQENTLLDYQPFARRTIWGILTAFILQIIWLVCLHVFTFYQTDFLALLTLLASVSSQNDLYVQAVKATADHSVVIMSYFISLYLFAFISGCFLRWVVRKFKWDQKGIFASFVRFESEWYYLFKGYTWQISNLEGVIVSATTELASQGYLYIGLLKDFSLNKEGDLDYLILTEASRRLIEKDKNSEKQNTEHFYPIDGDCFVLKYQEIKTLNISFIRSEIAK